MLLKTLMAKSRVTTFKVKSEITYEEKFLLYFWEKNFNRSLITQGKADNIFWKGGRS